MSLMKSFRLTLSTGEKIVVSLEDRHSIYFAIGNESSFAALRVDDFGASKEVYISGRHVVWYEEVS
jgi:hypothetical protein